MMTLLLEASTVLTSAPVSVVVVKSRRPLLVRTLPRTLATISATRATISTTMVSLLAMPSAATLTLPGTKSKLPPAMGVGVPTTGTPGPVMLPLMETMVALIGVKRLPPGRRSRSVTLLI